MIPAWLSLKALATGGRFLLAWWQPLTIITLAAAVWWFHASAERIEADRDAWLRMVCVPVLAPPEGEPYTIDEAYVDVCRGEIDANQRTVAKLRDAQMNNHLTIRALTESNEQWNERWREYGENYQLWLEDTGPLDRIEVYDRETEERMDEALADNQQTVDWADATVPDRIADQLRQLARGQARTDRENRDPDGVRPHPSANSSRIAAGGRCARIPQRKHGEPRPGRLDPACNGRDRAGQLQPGAAARSE